MAVSSKGRSLEIWSWSFYDFANSSFTTLVVTFVYATYFAQAIVGDAQRGTVLWSRGVAITAVAVALLSPVLGTIADRGGLRKLFLLLSTLICVGATAALYPVLPGQVSRALWLFVIANVAFELGMVFYNAFLPDIAPRERIGSISGNGWALGYVGGLLSLVLALVVMVQPEEPWFGLSNELGQNVRATNLLVAGWFLVFSLPALIWLREKRRVEAGTGHVLRETVAQLRATWQEVRVYRELVRFLVARLFYNDGLVTVIAFGALYASGTFGFTLEEVLLFGIVLNVAAAVGAFGLGFLDDRLGGKRTIQISLWGLVGASLLAILADSRALFWMAGTLVGIFMGPNQSASRSLMGRFVPDDKESEFFGFFAFSGKLTAFIGPLVLGILVQIFESQRVGMLIVVVLFVIGYVLLARVDEAKGQIEAGR